MIVKPMIRNNICLSAHPTGCAAETLRQIEYVKARKTKYEGLSLPKAVLVIGASGGYGLASRIAAAFGCGAVTVGMSLEREPSDTKTATPGWYNNKAFDRAAQEAGLAHRTMNLDAFSNEAKEAAIEAAQEMGIKYDLVIYSLASPVRTDPSTGIMHRSVIKPIGQDFSGTTVDVFTGKLSNATVGPATEEECNETVKVMGGEDWELWIQALGQAGVLADKCRTLAYSYIGPRLSWPIYRDGTLGRAKADLDATARRMTSRTAPGTVPRVEAYVSVNKAVVTRASAVIPVIPLYVSVLFRVMKERRNHEDCVAQMDRLFRERLCLVEKKQGQTIPGTVPTDDDGRIRMDDLEMSPGVQAEVEAAMAHITPENLDGLADLEGFRNDFLTAHGFAVPGVDYGADVDPRA
jgi:enoyl-[acyl-carrier protein] reductase/trans-2-enoyl-CoA reductase (NAD+)